MILAGDVGGTNTRLGIFSADGKSRIRVEIYPSKAHKSFEEIAKKFLKAGKEKPLRGCIGVAGPVIDGKCEATNLPWKLDAKKIGKDLGIKSLALQNDLASVAIGSMHAPRRKVTLLQGNAPPSATGENLAVISAGTGLGEAFLVWDGERHVACATEGGHVDFAPRNKVEIELFEFLQKRVGGRVSFERVVSGPGLGNLYDFFRDSVGVGETQAAADAVERARDRNALITELALTGKSKPAQRAVELFGSLYGSEAANLALKTLATGGVFVAGGIAAALQPLLKSGPFMKSFLDKGRMSALLAKIPVAIVLDSEVGLQGSAITAAQG
ncbi:MAG: glucokinase [Polyangiaceae bacterium]